MRNARCYHVDIDFWIIIWADKCFSSGHSAGNNNILKCLMFKRQTQRNQTQMLSGYYKKTLIDIINISL